MRCTFYHKRLLRDKRLADFLAEHPDPRAAKVYEDLPDEVAEVCLTQTSFESQVWHSSLTVHPEQAQKYT